MRAIRWVDNIVNLSLRMGDTIDGILFLIDEPTIQVRC